jgi:hypothetical protein
LGGVVDESEDEEGRSEEETGRAVSNGNGTKINTLVARFYTLRSG